MKATLVLGILQFVDVIALVTPAALSDWPDSSETTVGGWSSGSLISVSEVVRSGRDGEVGQLLASGTASRTGDIWNHELKTAHGCERTERKRGN